MTGTSRDVVVAMLRIPPRMTTATAAASSRPTIHARSAKGLLAAPVTSMKMAVAWLDWNMLPMPRQPTTMLAA
jgi:hypothetical protein